MNPVRFLRIAVQSLRAVLAFWPRSLFIVCGIGLGIASLTIILASMKGAGEQAAWLARQFGPSSINVMSGGAETEALKRAPMTMTWHDKQSIEGLVPGVQTAAPLLMGYRPSLRHGKKRYTTENLCGVSEAHGKTWGWYLSEGRDFTKEDIKNRAGVCFLGSIPKKALFGGANPIGKIVLVDDVPFTVIGVLSHLGMSGGGVSFDDRITIPVTTMIERFNLDRDRLTQMRVKFPADTTPDQMQEHVASLRLLLRELHHLGPDTPDDFQLFTMQSIIDFVNLIKGSVSIFLGIVAVIALLAGGFSQANLFYLSVSARKEEIGLRKAMGASQRDILLQFLMEAALLASGGAALGLLLGIGCGRLLASFDVMQIALSPAVFLWGFAAAVCVSIVSSLRPARNAANMQPAAALKGLS